MVNEWGLDVHNTSVDRARAGVWARNRQALPTPPAPDQRLMAGYEMMNMIRLGQIQGVRKGAVKERVEFMHQIFGMVA